MIVYFFWGVIFGSYEGELFGEVMRGSYDVPNVF